MRTRYRCAGIAVVAWLATPAFAGTLSIVDNIPGAFIDISMTGTPLGLSDNGEAVVMTTISNAVFSSGSVVVANNGGIGYSLADPNLAPDNEPLPSLRAFGGNQALLGFWDDIGNTVGGDVYVEELADRLVVQWDDKPFADDPAARITFQLQVIDGAIPGPTPYAQFLYADVEGNRAGGGQSATIGYQDGGTGFNTVQWSFNKQFAVLNGTVLSLIPEPGTAALVMIGGIVAVGRHSRRRRG